MIHQRIEDRVEHDPSTRFTHRARFVRCIHAVIWARLNRVHHAANLCSAIARRVMTTEPLMHYLSGRVWNDVIDRFADDLPYAPHASGLDIDLDGLREPVADAILRE